MCNDLLCMYHCISTTEAEYNVILRKIRQKDYSRVWWTSSLSNKWYLRTLCIGTASKSRNLKRPSLAACSQSWMDSRTHSSLAQRLSKRIWAKKKRKKLNFVTHTHKKNKERQSKMNRLVFIQVGCHFHAWKVFTRKEVNLGKNRSDIDICVRNEGYHQL